MSFTPEDWWMHNHDEEHSGIASGISKINKDTVNGLKLKYKFSTPRPPNSDSIGAISSRVRIYRKGQTLCWKWKPSRG